MSNDFLSKLKLFSSHESNASYEGKSKPLFSGIIQETRRTLAEHELAEAVSKVDCVDDSVTFYTVLMNDRVALKQSEFYVNEAGVKYRQAPHEIFLINSEPGEQTSVNYIDNSFCPKEFSKLDSYFDIPKDVVPGGILTIFSPVCSCGNNCYENAVMFYRHGRDTYEYKYFLVTDLDPSLRLEMPSLGSNEWKTWIMKRLIAVVKDD